MRLEGELGPERVLHRFFLHGICKFRLDSHQGGNADDSSPSDNEGARSCLQILLHDSLFVSLPPLMYHSTPLTIPSSYYFYFYTYMYELEVTTITSTFTTTTTTISVYAANSNSADDRLSSLSSSVEENDFTTPLAATSALNSTPARPTATGASSVSYGSGDSGDSDDSAVPVPPGLGRGPGTGDVSTGAGTQTSIMTGWAMAWAFGAGAVAVGMVWL